MTHAEQMQALVDSGDAWRLEGAVGREAMAMIEAGEIVLGEVGHRDYWGNYVPSRHEVVPGTKGSVEYAEARREERVMTTETRGYRDGHAVGHQVSHHGLDPSDATDDPTYARAYDLGEEDDWWAGYWDGREDPEDDA